MLARTLRTLSYLAIGTLHVAAGIVSAFVVLVFTLQRDVPDHGFVPVAVGLFIGFPTMGVLAVRAARQSERSTVSMWVGSVVSAVLLIFQAAWIIVGLWWVLPVLALTIPVAIIGTLHLILHLTFKPPWEPVQLAPQEAATPKGADPADHHGSE